MQFKSMVMYQQDKHLCAPDGLIFLGHPMVRCIQDTVQKIYGHVNSTYLTDSFNYLVLCFHHSLKSSFIKCLSYVLKYQY